MSVKILIIRFKGNFSLCVKIFYSCLVLNDLRNVFHFKVKIYESKKLVFLIFI